MNLNGTFDFLVLRAEDVSDLQWLLLHVLGHRRIADVGLALSLNVAHPDVARVEALIHDLEHGWRWILTVGKSPALPKLVLIISLDSLRHRITAVL